VAPERSKTLLELRGVRWALGGIGALVAIEVVLTIAGEDRYFVSVASFVVLVTVGGWAIGHYRKLFSVSIRGLADMTPMSTDDAEKAFTKWDKLLFEPVSPIRIILFLAVGTLWFATLNELGSVFDHAWANNAVYVFFVPVVIVGVWGSFIAVGVVWAVFRTVEKGLSAPFSVVRDPVIARMERGWRTAGFFILVVYLFLLAAFATGPHELDLLLMAWLVVFVTFPIAWFVVGGIQLHRMLSKLKGANVKTARKDVAKLAKALTTDSSSVTLQEFNAALDIESRTEAMPAWPSVPGGIASFVFAIIPIVIQASLVYAGIAESL
jgi:hypothetical protein